MQKVIANCNTQNEFRSWSLDVFNFIIIAICVSYVLALLAPSKMHKINPLNCPKCYWMECTVLYKSLAYPIVQLRLDRITIIIYVMHISNCILKALRFSDFKCDFMNWLGWCWAERKLSNYRTCRFTDLMHACANKNKIKIIEKISTSNLMKR